MDLEYPDDGVGINDIRGIIFKKYISVWLKQMVEDWIDFSKPYMNLNFESDFYSEHYFKFPVFKYSDFKKINLVALTYGDDTPTNQRILDLEIIDKRHKKPHRRLTHKAIKLDRWFTDIGVPQFKRTYYYMADPETDYNTFIRF